MSFLEDLSSVLKEEAFLETIKEAQPLAEKLVDAVLLFGPEVEKVCKRMVLSSINMKGDCVDTLTSRGFSREEAIVLVCDQWSAISKSLQNNSKKGASK